MKPNKKTFYFLSLLTLSATLAVAQEGERKGPPPGGEGGGGGRLAEFLKRADANGDGKISKEEYGSLQRGGGEDRFAKMDGNSDGFVDEAEIAAVAEKMREGMRDRKGGEGKGGESSGGFRRPPGDRPEGDRPEGGRPPGDRPSPPEGGRRPEGGPGGPGMIDEVFGRMDKNSDGNVDKAEYVEFSNKEIETRFDRTDADSDGKLTKDEVKAGLERMRNMMRGPGAPGGPGGRGPGGPDGAGRRGGPDGGGEGGGFRRPPSQEREGGERSAEKPEAPKKDAI